MKQFLIQFCFFVFVASFTTSCVSSKKYNQLLAQKNKSESNYRKYKKKFEERDTNFKTTSTALDEAEKALTQLKKDKSDLDAQLQTAQNEVTDLTAKVESLLKNQEVLASSSSSEKQRLNEALSAKEREIYEQEKALKLAKAELKEKEKRNVELTANLKEREKKVNELQAILNAQEARTLELKNKLTSALLGFSAADLSVELKNGKVYVSLSQNLLFASGSSNIDKKGKSALKKLAEVLNSNPDIDINVEGHTDNIPFRGRGNLKDNWDLSVTRSTSIVRVLVANRVDPTRITASGRGEFFPISDNATKEGRAINRRSDIILSPKLDELFNIINN